MLVTTKPGQTTIVDAIANLRGDFDWKAHRRGYERGLRSEAVEQARLIEWARMQGQAHKLPALSMLYSHLNGLSTTKVQASRLRAGGAIDGLPDLFLPQSAGRWHGLYIEMKGLEGQLSKSQLARGLELIEQGYLVTCCWGAQEAVWFILEYTGWQLPSELEGGVLDGR